MQITPATPVGIKLEPNTQATSPAFTTTPITAGKRIELPADLGSGKAIIDFASAYSSAHGTPVGVFLLGSHDGPVAMAELGASMVNGQQDPLWVGQSNWFQGPSEDVYMPGLGRLGQVVIGDQYADIVQTPTAGLRPIESYGRPIDESA